MHIKNDWKRDFTKAFNHSIGHGSFGKVILVRSKRNRQYFAMKEINLKQTILKSSIINRAYALDEGLKLRQLNATQHRNIIKYYKSYLHEDSIYWIMEYCDGGTLKDRINLYAKSDKELSEDLIWYWSMHILNGIKYIHNKGIIHRDLKPDNIYIESKRGVCKIGDFGFAKILVETSITENTSVKYLKFDDKYTQQQQQQQVKQVLVCKENVDEQKIAYKFIKVSQVGTPSYIAPELRMLIESHMTFCSIETVNKSIELCEENVYKGDIFSFGCILYELIHLRPAFENKFLLPLDEYYTQIFDQIDQKLNYSHDIKSLTKRCLERNPHIRPSIKQLFLFDSSIKQRLNQDFIDAYKAQVIPRLIISKKNGPLEYLKVKLENAYKPISMKSLKFNQNLIVILAYNQQKAQTFPKTKYKILTSTFNNMSPFQDNNNEAHHESKNSQNNPKLTQDQDQELEVADIKFFYLQRIRRAHQ
jgi:serine/threonine protein kinase